MDLVGFLSRNGARSVLTVSLLLTSTMSLPASAVVLSYQSIDSPSLAVFNGRLFMAYAGTDSNHRLNYAVSSDGLIFTQITDGNNRAGGGPAIAPFNGKMYVTFPGINDHRINIASSTDGQHYSGQFTINATTAWRPAIGAGGGKLYLAWLDSSSNLQVVSSTDGVTFTSAGSVNTNPNGSHVAYPPTLGAKDVNSVPTLVYTVLQTVIDFPPQLYVCQQPANIGFNSFAAGPCGTCRNSVTGSGIQAGIGYLPGETLLPWRSGSGGGSLSLDVNGGLGTNCPVGGSTFGPYGGTGVAPAVAGFNGHAYVAWTGNDGAQHINIVQSF